MEDAIDQLINESNEDIDEPMVVGQNGKPRKLKKWSVEYIEYLRTIMADATSLNASLNNDDPNSEEIISTIEDEKAINLYKVLEQEEQNSLLKKMILDLPPRQAKILLLRFGFEQLADDPAARLGNEAYNAYYTLEQIAKVFNVTRERIRQVEAKALNTLRKRITKSKYFKEE